MEKRLRFLHGRRAFFALVQGDHRVHMDNVKANRNQIEGGMKMFIRPVWQLGRAFNLPQILSEMSAPADRTSDQLGLYNHEFTLATARSDDLEPRPHSRING